MTKRRLEKGQSLVLIAMALVGIVAFVGFAIDTGIIYLNRTWLGQAVDAASLAAGYDLPNIKGACARAVEYLEANDYIAGSDFEYDIVFPNVPDAPGGDPGAFVINSLANGITVPDDCSKLLVPAEHQVVHYQVKVVGRQQVPAIFMSILGFGEIESGVDGLAERTRKFDISLVLDNSGSMVYDTCGYYRPVSGDPEGYTTYAANNLYPVCADIVGENKIVRDDFEAYDSTGMLEVEWDTGGNTDLLTNGGHDGHHFVELRAGGSNQAFLLKRNTAFDVRNPSPPPSDETDIALFFWVKNISMGSNDFLEIHWREWDGAEPLPDEDDWLPLSRIEGNNLDNSWKEIGIVMPSAAANKEYLQIRFGTLGAELNEGVGIDDVVFKSCPPVREEILPVREYKRDSGDETGCRTGGKAGPMNADTLAPHTMIPMVPGVNDEPVTWFLEQPMYDVLRSTETFIDLIDARRFDTNPPREREDEFSLVTFSNSGRLLSPLTDNYEEIKHRLFTGIEGESWTNLGDGMRLGLMTLEEGGRSNTLHFMVLLTDGRPNRYGKEGGETLSVNRPDPDQSTLNYIAEQIDFANEQNVTVFTIGLGEAMLDNFADDALPLTLSGEGMFKGQDILRQIAKDTGGEAYYAPTTKELQEAFEAIAEAIFVRLEQ